VRRAQRWTRVWLGLSVLVLLGLSWGLTEHRRVVDWTQGLVRTTLAGLLRQAD
jgi:hypothetical protein